MGPILARGPTQLALDALALDDVREQIRFGGLMFGGFLASAIVFGWLMYAFPL